MTRSIGHRYRIRFTLGLWVALIWLFIITPSNRYLVSSPYTRTILLCAALLTLSFTLLTFVFWARDRRRERKAQTQGK